jgi:K+-sensing histidine kinase KdpD
MPLIMLIYTWFTSYHRTDLSDLDAIIHTHAYMSYASIVLSFVIIALISFINVYIWRRHHLASKRLKAKEDLFKILSHDMIAPLLSMDHIATEVINKTNTNEIESALSLLSHFKTSISGLHILTSDMLAWIWSAHYDHASTSLAELGDHIGRYINPMSQYKNSSFTYQVDQSIVSHQVNSGVAIILRNIISNILKHSNATEISLHITAEHDLCICSVQDNADTLPDEVYYAMQHHLTNLMTSDQTPKRGLGLLLISQYTKSTGARLEIVRSAMGNSYVLQVSMVARSIDLNFYSLICLFYALH